MKSGRVVQTGVSSSWGLKRVGGWGGGRGTCIENVKRPE